MPFTHLQIVIFIVISLCLVVFIQISALSLAFFKLGLSYHSALLLFGTSLFGSFINLPLLSIRSQSPIDSQNYDHGFLIRFKRQENRKIIIAVNVGGCLIPVFFSIYLLMNNPINPLSLVVSIGIVSFICYVTSRPIKGVGIGMPMLVAPITAALVAILIGDDQRSVIAYVSGVLGVLIGADILRIRDVVKIGAPIASIGGAGTFDGIFITGLVAVLLT